VKAEEKIVADYRGQVRQARDQFSNELESVVPDVKISRRLDGTFVGHKQSSFADRTFAAAAPRLSDIRQPDLSYGQFRRSLKTFF